jgi:uncharacterized protein YlxP (DUF503 family)
MQNLAQKRSQMNQEQLKEKRVILEASLKRKVDAHYQKFASSLNESAYQDSCNEIALIYKELAEVCEDLGDPIPVRF